MKTRLREWTRELLPITTWLSDYSRAALRGDVVAGITVGVMLIPQGMAYALIAGMPPIYGLYAALIPLVAYPLAGSSRHLALGPTAIDMLIMGAGLGALAEAGTNEYVALAILLTAMVGGIQIGMGMMRFGFVANLLSRPVIAGLTTAAAFIISFSQIGNLLGVELGRSQYVYVLVDQAFAHLGEVHLLSLALGAGCIVLLVGLPRWMPQVPEMLVVAVLATVASWIYALPEAGVAIIGTVPSGLPLPDIPEIGITELRTLLPAAFTLALVQFLNVVTLGRTFAARHGYTIDANRELIAVGTANLLGSFFRSIPTSGSFSRSAVNERAGARTPIANVATALVIALTLLFLTPLFYYMPMPALAALIIVAGFNLVDLRELVELYQTRRRDVTIAVFTALCTLIVGIQEGILLGISANVIAVLYRISRPNVAELGHVPGTRLFRDLDRFNQALRIQDIMVLRVDAAFSFANAEYFKDFIVEKSEREGRSVDVVVVDGTSINDLDTTAIDALESTIETLDKQGIELHLTGLIGPVREVVRRSGLHDLMGENSFHMDPHDAVVDVLERWDKEDDSRRVARYFAETSRHKKEATPAAS